MLDLCEGGVLEGEGGERREKTKHEPSKTEASFRGWLLQECRSERSFGTTARHQNSRVAERCGGTRQNRVCEPKPGDEPRDGGSAGLSLDGIQNR